MKERAWVKNLKVLSGSKVAMMCSKYEAIAALC